VILGPVFEYEIENGRISTSKKISAIIKKPTVI